MKIRKTVVEDKEKLIHLMIKADNRSKEWAEERINSYANKNGKLILVAEKDSDLIGFIGIKKYEDNEARKFADLDNFIWVTWLAVLPEYRKKKIGSKLLKAVDEYVNIFNKLGIILDCREKVLDFYTKAGYKIVGEYEDKNSPRFVMSKLKDI